MAEDPSGDNVKTSRRGDVDPFIVMDVMEAARQEELAGRSVIHMEVGQPGTPAPAQARDRLVAASDGYAAALGRPYARITLRDTRSRWGSCTSDGGLMYSWRLILAPPEILDYVAAHEVAHLKEMNHSSAFWAVATQLYGPSDEARHWLRNAGSELHRYRFATTT